MSTVRLETQSGNGDAGNTGLMRHGRVLVLFQLVLLLLVGASLYWPVLASLAERWDDPDTQTYTHGYFILPVAAFLLYSARDRLSVAVSEPALWLLLPLTVCGFCWLILYRAGVEIGHQALFPILLWMSIYAALGRRIAWVCALPMAYIYFGIPVWDALIDELQALTVLASRVTMRLSGIPVYFEGNFVHIPAGVFEIQGGCSGLNFLLVGVAIATLYGELQRDSLRIRTLLLVLAVALSIASNWIRVFVIILAGHLTDMQHHFVRVEHFSLGWGIFAVSMVAFFFLAQRLPASVIPDPDKHESSLRSFEWTMGRGVILAIAAMALAPVWSLVNSRQSQQFAVAPLLVPIDGWSGPVEASGTWRPEYPAADQQDIKQYSSAEGVIEAFVALYYTQRQGKELVGYGNSATGQELLIRELVTVGTASGGEIKEALVIDAQDRQSIVHFGYEVGGRSFVSGIRSQLWYGFASLGAAPVSQVVAVRAMCEGDCDRARELVGRFWLRKKQWLLSGS